MASNSEIISIEFVACRSLARIGLQLEIVNSDGCGVLRTAETKETSGCGDAQRVIGWDFRETKANARKS
jgi:hypothetical protein